MEINKKGDDDGSTDGLTVGARDGDPDDFMDGAVEG